MFVAKPNGLRRTTQLESGGYRFLFVDWAPRDIADKKLLHTLVYPFFIALPPFPRNAVNKHCWRCNKNLSLLLTRWKMDCNCYQTTANAERYILLVYRWFSILVRLAILFRQRSSVLINRIKVKVLLQFRSILEKNHQRKKRDSFHQFFHLWWNAINTKSTNGGL